MPWATTRRSTSGPTSAIANVNDVGVATITGTPVQGKTLTAAVTDLDGLANVTITYSWQQLIGTTWTNIAGATGQSWTLQAAQVGRQVRVRATYTDQLGGVETNRASAPTPLVSSASNHPGVLGISGTPTQNQVLTAVVTDADGVPGSVSYQWQQSSNGTTWTNIGGATANTLTLQQAQVGSFVRATASYVDVLGNSENVIGPATPSTSPMSTTPRCSPSRPATRTRSSARPSPWCCPPAPSPMSMPATR